MVPSGRLLQTLPSSFVSLEGSWRLPFRKGDSLVSSDPLSLLPATPCKFLPYSSTPDPPSPPFLSVALKGRTWVSIQTWKRELPLSPQNVIISENLGHTTTEKVTLPTSLYSVARHLLPLSDCNFSWGWTLTLRTKTILWWGGGGRAGGLVVGEQQRQPPPKCNGLSSFCRELQQFTTLNIWCLAVFRLEWKERERKKKSHVPIRVSLLILEARINFLSYSSRRGSTLEFPSGILLKHPGTPLNPCFLEENQLRWLFFFLPSQHSISPHIQVFTLCWKKTKLR